MKKHIIAAAVILFLSNSLYSAILPYIFSSKDSLTCSEDIKISFVQTSKKAYDTTDADIEIVFDGVYVDYPFEQLGYIEISGTDTTDINDIMDCLKTTAAAKGADAVINIKRLDTKSRITFSGILIRHVSDEASDETSSTGEDDPKIIDKKLTVSEKFLTILAGAFIVSVYVISEIHY